LVPSESPSFAALRGLAVTLSDKGRHMTLEEEISTRIGEVHTDSFDMSFSEIANLHKNKG